MIFRLYVPAFKAEPRLILLPLESVSSACLVGSKPTALTKLITGSGLLPPTVNTNVFDNVAGY